MHVHLHVEVGALDGAPLGVAQRDLERVLADARARRVERRAELEARRCARTAPSSAAAARGEREPPAARDGSQLHGRSPLGQRAERAVELGVAAAHLDRRFLVAELRVAQAALGVDHGREVALSGLEGRARGRHAVARGGQHAIAEDLERVMRLGEPLERAPDREAHLVVEPGAGAAGLLELGLRLVERGRAARAPERQVQREPDHRPHLAASSKVS